MFRVLIRLIYETDDMEDGEVAQLGRKWCFDGVE